MVDTNYWKQKDVAEKLGVKPSEAKAYRDKFLEAGTHWEKDGATIYWTDHAFWMFKKHLTTPVTDTKEIEVFITSLAPNPSFVFGDLDGNRISIKCSPRLSQRILRKKVKVSVREENGEIYYSYNL
jgi:uncharacterized protein YneR